MTLDHVGFAVADFAKSRDFYTRALAPLGIAIVMGGDGYAGMGRDGRAQFWFNAGKSSSGGTHIAFAADDRAQVRAFHAAAIAAGGTNNGDPGLRPQYHPNYYGAFVIDLNGHNIEAVCHKPEN